MSRKLNYKFIKGIGPCYALSSGMKYIKEYGWKLSENSFEKERIYKESKVNLIK